MINAGDYLTAPQIGEMLGLTGAAINNRARKGTFPGPVVPGVGRGNTALWRKHTVEAWIQQRAELIDLYQIAEWLGISTSTMYIRSHEYPLPEPDLVDGTTRLWHWVKIQEWASQFVEWEEDQ